MNRSGGIKLFEQALLQRYLNYPINNQLLSEIENFISQIYKDREMVFSVHAELDQVFISPNNMYTGLRFIGQTPDPVRVAMKTIEMPNGFNSYEDEFGRYELNRHTGTFNFYPKEPIEYIKVDVKLES